jgi:ligand-binding sensor domain-containing protein
VAEQGDGVWIGTEAGAAFVSLAGPPKVVRTVVAAPVSAVHVSPTGAVFLGTRGAGLFRLATKEATPELVRSSVQGTRISAITEKDAALYVAYGDGPLAKLDKGILQGVDRSPTHGQALATVGSDLVLGDLEGLFRVDRAGVTSLSSIDARGIASSGTSMLVATYGSGLMSGTTRGALRAEPGVPKLARSVTVRGAMRCVATADGVFVHDGSASSGFHKVWLGGPPSNDVTSLAPNSGGTRIAVGTFEAGASTYENGTFTRVQGLDRNESVSAVAWQGDRLWLATAHGIVRVAPNGATRRFTSSDGLPNSFTRAIHVLSTNRILVGTDAGAVFIEGEKVTPLVPTKKDERPSIASPMHATWALASSADGTLYIGTAAGLYYGRDGRFERASLATGELADDWVTALAVSGSDVFVGTYSKGIARLRFDGKKPSSIQLGGGYVNEDGLLVSEGKLFAATMDHLLVRPLGDDGAKWEVAEHASTGRDVTAIRTFGAETWVASRRGIAISR